MSPLINVGMYSKDFIKFCKKPQEYLDMELETLWEMPYPVFRLGDIVLFFAHYKSSKEAKEKWKTRLKRINWNNIFIIMTERDGCSYEDLIEFDQLPWENKVVFVHKEMPEIKSAVYLPGTEINGDDFHHVQPLTNWKGRLSGKRLMDSFDFREFIQNGMK